jgi:hypothetical protein
MPSNQEMPVVNESTPRRVQLVLASEDTNGRLIVDLRRFLEFASSVDAGMDTLVADWIHMAAPVTVTRNRFGGASFLSDETDQTDEPVEGQ